MDSAPESQDMLDLLAFDCSTLTNKLWYSNSVDEKRSILTEYLTNADKTGQPIADFKEDLDWFNVTQPLSFENSLKGKIVVLDFFTYCCINCMHILPDLKRLEHLYSVEAGMVVIGVHSAKFDNEKDSSNILSAIQRYNITHPVVNDNTSSMWTNLNIQCWPTILILGPKANPLFVTMGEGHFDDLNLYISSALKFYKEKGEILANQLPLNPSTDLVMPSNLHFPGKIASLMQQVPDLQLPLEIYAISDQGNHRILIINNEGDVIHKIGGKQSGFVDGDFKKARFNGPQGVCFLNENILFVADTDNHAIRRIDLKKQSVVTIVGNGEQGNDRVGGKMGREQLISSPWDVIVYKTRNMDMSFHVDESKIPEKHVLLIAMAGIHQIWALFVEDTVWWKFKKFEAGVCVPIAGNGREENRNNAYPQNASFAQPSGLSINRETRELYIADSESSSVRKISLVNGNVLAVAGGDRNPLDLFSYGDVDGKQFEAKFQHCIGLTHNPKDNMIYLADTYNHKIKKINPGSNIATTLVAYDITNNPYQFNEPAGLCVDPKGEVLFVANTNNHKIDMIDLKEMKVKTLHVRFNATGQQNEAGNIYHYTHTLSLCPNGGKINLKIEFDMLGAIKMTNDAPQKWTLNLPVNGLWISNTLTGLLNTKKPTELEIQVPSEKLNKSREDEFAFTFKLNLCADGICFPKLFTLTFSTSYDADGADFVGENVQVNVGKENVKIYKI